MHLWFCLGTKMLLILDRVAKNTLSFFEDDNGGTHSGSDLCKGDPRGGFDSLRIILRHVFKNDRIWNFATHLGNYENSNIEEELTEDSIFCEWRFCLLLPKSTRPVTLIWKQSFVYHAQLSGTSIKNFLPGTFLHQNLKTSVRSPNLNLWSFNTLQK